MEEDRIILEGICRREQDAFRKLFDKYGTYVVAVTAKVAGGALSGQDIEEISSDVFAKLWKKAPELRLPNGSLKNLIGVMARNCTLNALRSKNRILEDRLDEEAVFCPSAACPSAEERYIERETAAALWAVINELEALDREIFLRRYFYLEKVKDIARDKEMNEKTVGSRLARARQKLRDAVGKRGEAEHEA
ncbi:MAG TPA: sigma-70 family RNA polymerase sigma factor [Anaerovoracaceae bacterium]|nr:sigma-70 family RNA polymerase sigma factor [Anaerovoracaceae bacterium]